MNNNKRQMTSIFDKDNNPFKISTQNTTSSIFPSQSIKGFGQSQNTTPPIFSSGFGQSQMTIPQTFPTGLGHTTNPTTNPTFPTGLGHTTNQTTNQTANPTFPIGFNQHFQNTTNRNQSFQHKIIESSQNNKSEIEQFIEYSYQDNINILNKKYKDFLTNDLTVLIQQVQIDNDKINLSINWERVFLIYDREYTNTIHSIIQSYIDTLIQFNKFKNRNNENYTDLYNKEYEKLTNKFKNEIRLPYDILKFIDVKINNELQHYENNIKESLKSSIQNLEKEYQQKSNQIPTLVAKDYENSRKVIEGDYSNQIQQLNNKVTETLVNYRSFLS